MSEMRICPRWQGQCERRNRCAEAKPHECSGASFYCPYVGTSLKCIILPKEYQRKIKEPALGTDQYLERMGLRKDRYEDHLDDFEDEEPDEDEWE